MWCCINNKLYRILFQKYIMTTLNEDNNNNSLYDKFNNSDSQIKLYLL